jgi:nucleoid-associated protein YgaU
MTKKILVVLILAVLGGGLFAQSLENNEYYRQSVEYANLSQRALDAGDYVLAREHAIKSQEYAALSRAYIQAQLLAYRARSSYVAAKARMDLAGRINLRTHDRALYDEASGVFTQATGEFNAEDWENSITSSRRVIELLRDMDSRYAAVERAPEGLAAFYRVKLNLEKRDCLWRIAGFDYIYGNSWEWKRLYEANKDTFPDPNNPDLIHPDMILRIPSIRGEARSGTR